MNDRFKFRVWYNPQPTYDDYPKMLYDAEKTYDFMRTPELIPADSFGELLENEDFIVMQSTGLKDKNGKLIFEGDVVKFKTPRTGLRIGQVKFDVNCALFEVRYLDNTNDWELMDKYNYEIIGNIYENKELLL